METRNEDGDQEQKAQKPGYVPFTLSEGSAEDRAKMILAEARAQIKLGAKEVGIIRPVVKDGNVETDVDLRSVLTEVRKLLDTPENADLKDKFKFLPISIAYLSETGVRNSALGPVIDRNLGDVAAFLSQNNSVLGWDSASFKKDTLTSDQKNIIKTRLSNFEREYPAAAVTSAKQAEQSRRDAESDSYKKFAQKYREIWREKNNKQDWINLVDFAETKQLRDRLSEAGSEVTQSAGEGSVKPVMTFESGFYKPTGGAVYTKLAYLHFEKENMSVSMVSRTTRLPSTDYRDHANGRDFLQSQGCSHIRYDYNKVNAVNSVDTIKYLLDSIYQSPGWEAAFDKNGNVKDGAKVVYKEPPVGIELGPTIQKYIADNIGFLQSKNPFLRRKAERCQKMLALSKLSLANVQDYKQESLANPEKKKDVEDAAPAAPPPPPGGEPAPIIRNPEPAPEEIQMDPQQPPLQSAAVAQVNQGEQERREALIRTAQELGGAVTNLADIKTADPYFANLQPQESDVFSANEIKHIQQIGALIDKMPGLDEGDRLALKEVLKNYVDESRINGSKLGDKHDLVKDKFDEIRHKISQKEDKAGLDQIKQVEAKFTDNVEKPQRSFGPGRK